MTRSDPDEGILRSIIEYEADVIEAHLSYASMPKTLRIRLERQPERLRALASGSTEPWEFSPRGWRVRRD